MNPTNESEYETTGFGIANSRRKKSVEYSASRL